MEITLFKEPHWMQQTRIQQPEHWCHDRSRFDVSSQQSRIFRGSGAQLQEQVSCAGRSGRMDIVQSSGCRLSEDEQFLSSPTSAFASAHGGCQHERGFENVSFEQGDGAFKSVMIDSFE